MTVYNTLNKLKTRPIGELDKLSVGTLQSSYREIISKVNVENEARNTLGFNTLDRISRRNYNELNGLSISTLEKSKMQIETNINNLKLVRPLKTYKAKIKLLFDYKINIK